MQDSDTEPRARLRGISKMGHVGAGIDIARADVLIDLVLCVLLPWVFDQLPARVQSVDLSDPSLNQPVLEEIVSGNMNVLLAVVVPFASFVVVELSKPWKLRLDVFQLFAIGLLESCGITTTVTLLAKNLIGRPRPYFATVCESYSDAAHTFCVGNDKKVDEARRSFPSGHSSLSFAFCVYLSMYLAAATGLASSQKPGGIVGRVSGAKSWKICVVFLPLLLATFIAYSRLIDFHHHYSDVVGGSCLGTGIAIVVGIARIGDYVTFSNTVLQHTPGLPRTTETVSAAGLPPL